MLNWSPTLYANYSHHLHSSLERFFKHCCHVKIFGKIENVRKKVFTCIFWSKWNCKHFIFFNNQSEDISYLMDTESFSKNHSTESLRHSSKHNFVFTQQTWIQYFFYHIVPGSFSLEDFRADVINKSIGYGFWVLLLLKVGVWVSIKTLFIFDLIRKFILSDHIECEEIDDCLLPTEGSVRVNETNSIQSIIFNFSHRTSVRHESLSCNIRWRINL